MLLVRSRERLALNLLFDGGFGKAALHHLDARRHDVSRRGRGLDAQAGIERAVGLGDGHELARKRSAVGLFDAFLEELAYFEHARPRDGIHILFEGNDLVRLAHDALFR